MSYERFASVWDAIEDAPGEAQSMKLRSALLVALKEQIGHQGGTQKPPAGSA